MKNDSIDWMALGQAQAHYQLCGYEWIDVPWLVPSEAVAVTRPEKARDFQTFAGCLVASGEQSLLAIRDQLELGKRYACVTPCFRDERHDDLHKLCFVKLELMHVLPQWDDPEVHVLCMLQHAIDFHAWYAHGCELRYVQTEIGYDIEINRVEVGSYGYREHEGFRWVYGTGVAMPRLRQVQFAPRPEGAVLVSDGGRGVPRLRPRPELQGEGVRPEAGEV